MIASKVNKATFATCIGYIALIIWACIAVVVTFLQRIPLFELLAIALFISFFITALKLTIYRQWHIIKQPLLIWVIGVVGIYGNDLTFIAAIKNAPPIHADLINYLWPIFVVLFAGFLPKERFTLKYIIAGLLGFIGIYILITGGNIINFQEGYLKGYLFALLDAIIWAAYTLLSRYYYKTPIEMIGMYCGIGALLSLIAHCNFETTVMLTPSEISLILIMGAFSSGLAYFLWDYGLKKGDFKLLSILSYGNPVISCGLLILFNKAVFTLAVSIACLFVILGAIIARLEFNVNLLHLLSIKRLFNLSAN